MGQRVLGPLHDFSLQPSVPCRYFSGSLGHPPPKIRVDRNSPQSQRPRRCNLCPFRLKTFRLQRFVHSLDLLELLIDGALSVLNNLLDLRLSRRFDRLNLKAGRCISHGDDFFWVLRGHLIKCDVTLKHGLRQACTLWRRQLNWLVYSWFTNKLFLGDLVLDQKTSLVALLETFRSLVAQSPR